MELVRIKKSEQVVFGKGFVPAIGAFFSCTDEEIAQFRSLMRSGEWIHLIIDSAGKVTLNGDELRSPR